LRTALCLVLFPPDPRANERSGTDFGSHFVKGARPLRFRCNSSFFLWKKIAMCWYAWASLVLSARGSHHGATCEGLGVRRVKIDFYDESGCRHTISLEGPLTRDKIGRILDYAELMGGLSSKPALNAPPSYARTKLERIRDLLVHRLRDTMFSSDEVRNLYQEFYAEPIPLTTVATYLSRLADRGLMRRSFSSGRWRYCLADSATTVPVP